MRWHLQRLGRHLKTPDAPPRPGDAVIAEAALYQTALAQSDDALAVQSALRLTAVVEQATRASGITTEGSSLRQRQLTLAVTEAWLAAHRQARPEQARLASATRRLMGALDAITLPGGLPEIGDAPVAAPPYAESDDEDRRALEQLRRQSHLYDLEALRADGWLRLDRGPWSGLWHCPPDGWPQSWGLAHQDLGAAELHWHGLPLIVDPGSPPTRQSGLASLYRSHAVHSGISLQSRDPYPFDRPGYSTPFRREIADPPVLRCTADGVSLTIDGYARLGGHRQIERRWCFDGDGLRIDDLVLGTGRTLIERRLVTPWTVSTDGNGLSLEQAGHHLRLTGDMPFKVYPARRWSADGAEQPLTLILFTDTVNLPWRGTMHLAPAS